MNFKNFTYANQKNLAENLITCDKTCIHARSALERSNQKNFNVTPNNLSTYSDVHFMYRLRKDLPKDIINYQKNIIHGHLVINRYTQNYFPLSTTN